MPFKITESCASCGACFDECPSGAIEEVEGGYRINPEKCEDCGSCVDICPNEAIVEE